MFNASLGTTVKVTTVIIVGLFLLIGVALLLLFVLSLSEENFDRKSIMMPIVAIGLFGLLYWVFTERIIGYEVLNEGVKIIKGNDVQLIKKDLILEVKSIDYKDLRFSVRTFGIGGVFGFSASFTNKKFGDMTWSFTSKDNLVMIVTQKQKFVVSPDNRTLFITKVSEFI